jgi:hypothetical protein
VEIKKMPRPQAIPVPPAKTREGAIAGILIGMGLLGLGIFIICIGGFAGLGWGVWLTIFAASVVRWGYLSYRRLSLLDWPACDPRIKDAFQPVHAKPEPPMRNQWLAEGEALMAEKHYNAAIKVFINAVGLDMNSAPAWFALGEAAHLAGDIKLAISSFEYGLKFAPNDTAAQAHLKHLQQFSSNDE